MPGAPSYAEAFSPLPGRCFRLVAHHGAAGPTSRLVAKVSDWLDLAT